MMLSEFRRRFWQPPRPHGDVVADRSISFLELFYDLVYVVTVAVSAGTLARDISWQTVAEFTVVFGLIWLAWFNGTVLHDLHGREDIRTRAYTFGQMLLIVLLAVYVGDAAGDGGREFALIYSGFVALLLWLWFSVRRQDDARFMTMTRRYMTVMAFALIVMLASGLMPNEGRVPVWGVLLAVWLVTLVLLGRGAETISEHSIIVSRSTVERFGLFIIIVLGELVVGVVDGLTEGERDLATVATGLVALVIVFGLWWNYFDLAGRRLPRADPSGSPAWMVGHLPLTLSIVAAGAAMADVIEHAAEARAPVAATWLLAASTALGLVSLIFLVRTLRDYHQMSEIYRPTIAAMLIGAAAALLLGVWRPSPLVLVSGLAAIHTLVWIHTVVRQLSATTTSG